MKIYLKDDEGHRIFLPIPNGILYSRFVLNFISKKCSLSSEQSEKLLKTVRQMKKLHRKLTLVDVVGEDGERIKITL